MLGFLQRIGESFGIRPKASSKSADLISGRFDGLRISAANGREFRNSPEGNGWRVEDLIWITTKNKENTGLDFLFPVFLPPKTQEIRNPGAEFFISWFL